jgi:3-oxoacid CoA-transferase subunit B
VRDIVTDLAYLTVEEGGFVLREVAPGVEVERVRQLTAAPLRVPDDVREMTFS